jgi:hypothetical protein
MCQGQNCSDAFAWNTQMHCLWVSLSKSIPLLLQALRTRVWYLTNVQELEDLTEAIFRTCDPEVRAKISVEAGRKMIITTLGNDHQAYRTTKGLAVPRTEHPKKKRRWVTKGQFEIALLSTYLKGRTSWQTKAICGRQERSRLSMSSVMQ